jgi:hypothetical protein
VVHVEEVLAWQGIQAAINGGGGDAQIGNGNHDALGSHI